MADEESKSIPHELPNSHWLKATGQCVLERYLSVTIVETTMTCVYKGMSGNYCDMYSSENCYVISFARHIS